jgi:vanillate O-demethylase ferredoxin subunit
MELVHRRSCPRRDAHDPRISDCAPRTAACRPTPAGSHIGVTVLIDGQPRGAPIRWWRTAMPATYRIAVRLAPDSRGGSRGMWNLRSGRADRDFKSGLPARNRLDRKNYCLIAGGIGITPITGIAAALRRRNIDAPLHYAVKSRGDAGLPRRALGAARRSLDRARLR